MHREFRNKDKREALSSCFSKLQWGSEYRSDRKLSRLPNGLVCMSPVSPVFHAEVMFLNTRLPFDYRTSEYRTSKSQLFIFFCYSVIQYSDPHCIFLKLYREINIFFLVFKAQSSSTSATFLHRYDVAGKKTGLSKEHEKKPQDEENRDRYTFQ